MRGLFLAVLCLNSCAAEELDDHVTMSIVLEGDDQCESDSSNDCALRALQVAAAKNLQVERAQSHDISVEFFEKANTSLWALQPYIVKEWTQLQLQNQRVETMMAEMQNATNQSVIWNAGGGPAKHSGRRRRRSVGKHLPKRTKYIMYLVVRVQKELSQFWQTYALVDRKRVGILNEIEIYPEGPSTVPKRSTAALVEQTEVLFDAEDMSQHKVFEFTSADDHDEDSDEEETEEVTLADPDEDEPRTNKDVIEDSFASMIADIKDAKKKTQNLTSHMDSTLSIAKAWLARR